MANNTQAVPAQLVPDGKPGQEWPSHLKGPIGDGSSVSALPAFGGPPPPNVSGAEYQHKLGMGTADPTVHGGG